MNSEHHEYRVVGLDGREYGPVGLATLAQWVREGRVTRATLVRVGDGPLVAAGTLDEIARSFPLTEAFPPAARVGIPPHPEAVSIPSEFRAWGFIERGWEIVKEDWIIFGTMFLLVALINAVPYVGPVVGCVIDGALTVGIWRAILGRLEGRRPTVGMMFDAFDRFGDAFLATIVMSVLLAIGFAICIVPGIYLAIMWAFTYPIIGETRMGFWDAMQASVRLTRGHRMELLLLCLASILVVFLGLLFCIVGVFVALPVVYAAFAFAYRHLQDEMRRGAGGAPDAAAVPPSPV
jgi:hypothetical protein